MNKEHGGMSFGHFYDFNLVMLEMKNCISNSKVCEDLLVGNLIDHGIKIWGAFSLRH